MLPISKLEISAVSALMDSKAVFQLVEKSVKIFSTATTQMSTSNRHKVTFVKLRSVR